MSLALAKQWRQGEVEHVQLPDTPSPPTHPGRPSDLTVVEPKDAPRRGKAGSLSSRIAMLHSLVHIESVAIDLSWDIIARFASEDLPREFFDDWVTVAEDEARVGLHCRHSHVIGGC